MEFNIDDIRSSTMYRVLLFDRTNYNNRKFRLEVLLERISCGMLKRLYKKFLFHFKLLKVIHLK